MNSAYTLAAVITGIVILGLVLIAVGVGMVRLVGQEKRNR
jgi:hypothetical protein